jgi:hypothetical protein
MGETHTVIATLRNAGDPSAGQNPLTCTGTEVERGFPVYIDFEIYPQNPPGSDPEEPNGDTPVTPDLTCTIPAGSTSCSVTYTGTDPGRDNIRGWIDEDGNHDPNNDGNTSDSTHGSTADADLTETRNESGAGAGLLTEPDGTDVVEKRWGANVDCFDSDASATPADPSDDETDTNQLPNSHAITCRATDAAGNPESGLNIDTEITGANDPDDGDSKTSPDLNTCTSTDADGRCTVTHTPGDGEVGQTVYRSWHDTDGDNSTTDWDATEGRDETTAAGEIPEPDYTDVTEKTWVPGGGATVDCDDESGDDIETNRKGQAENYRCVVLDDDGNPVTGAFVDGENLSGINDPDSDANDNPAGTTPAADPNDYVCGPTNASGVCNVSVPGSDPQGAGDQQEVGTANICFWVDTDHDSEGTESFNMGTSSDGDPADGGQCDQDAPDPADGEKAPPTDEPEGSVGLDESDSVSKTWQGSNVDELVGGLDAQPETATNKLEDFHTISATVYDQFGQFVEGKTDLQVKFEFFMGSPSDRDNNTPPTPDQTCTLGDSSDTNSTAEQRATCSIRYRPQPPRQTAGRDLVCVWHGTRPPVMAGTNTNGLCDGEGFTDTTADNGVPSPATDRVDVVEKWWAAANIECTQDSERSRSGEPNTITCKATNANNAPVSGQAIDAEYDGAGNTDGNADRTSPDDTCTTGADGTCTFEHTSANSGQTNYTFWIDEDQNNATTTGDSDQLTHTWTASRVDCNPETDENPIGDSHTVTCSARDAGNTAVAGEQIDWELSGANDPDEGDTPGTPDHTCVTGSDGSCSFTHTGTETGTTIYRAWLDDDDDNQAEDADTSEEVDSSNPVGAGGTAEPDSTDVVEKNWIGPGLDCTPETATNPTGVEHVITCTLRDSNAEGISGRVINVEITGANDPDNSNNPPPDLTCTTGADGSCQVRHTGNAPGETLYRAWAEGSQADSTEAQNENTPATAGAQAEPDETDVVAKTWVTQVLNCDPETDSNPTGSSHTVTCEAETSQGVPLSGANIDVEVTGVNDPDNGDTPETPDFSCTTDRTGTCSFTHGPGASTSTSGITAYRAWIDRDGVHTTTPQTHGTVEADRTEGRNEATAPGAKPEPDDTDVVEKTWVTQQLDCEPETKTNPTNTAHTVTCTVTTGSGSSRTVVQGSNVDAEATGANDPDNGDTPTSPDFTCTTNDQGVCSFTHGPGGTGRTSNGGTTTYRAWVDADRNNATVEADTTEGRNEGFAPGSEQEVDDTDVVEKLWSAPPIDCSPEIDGNPTGTAHTVTCAAQPNTQIDVEASGANDPDSADSPASPDFTCTTNTSGVCTFTHGPGGTGTTTARGTTTYRAWIDLDGANATVEADLGEGRNENATPGRTEPDNTDVVEKNWTAQASSVSISPRTDSASVGTCNPYTVTITDAAGAGVEGVIIDIEQRHANSENTTAGDEPQVGFCTPAATKGANPSPVDQTGGDLDAPEENPDNPGTLGGETDIATNSSGQVTFGITSTAAGTSDGTGLVGLNVFIDSDGDDDPDSEESKDTASKTWVTTEARSIDCEPENTAASTGASQTITCTVTDRFGEPLQGHDVVFTEEGPGSFTGSTRSTTDANGRASATVSSDENGSQKVTGTIADDTEGSEPSDIDDCNKAAGDPTGAPAGQCSDSVTVEWGGGTTPTTCRGNGNVIEGTPGADTITGTSGRDIICGKGGADVIQGKGGNDLIFGNNGDDTISGGSGKDKIYGAAGADNVSGNSGNDLLKGGPSNDTLKGNAGADRLRGGGGNDSLQGGGGTDDLTGGGGDDSLRGGPGRDRLDGGTGNDACLGNAASDRRTRCE